MTKKTVAPVYLHFGLVALVLVVAAVAPGKVYLRSKFARVAAPGQTNLAQTAPVKAGASMAPVAVALTPLASMANARVVRVVNGSILQGQNIVVAVQLDSQGDENAVGFSLTFDTTKLTYVTNSAVNGSDAAAATLLVNDSQAPSGKVGIGESLNPNVTFPAGTREILRLTFTAAPTAAGATTVGFGDQPIAREVVGKTVNDLTPTTDFTSGTVTINNHVPTLANIAPTNVLAGSGALTLTVNGADFNGSSVVRWSGSNRATTFGGNTQLTAAITAADVANAGNFSVTVFNAAPGGGESAVAAFTVNNPAPTISTLSPSTKTANEAAFTLTVNGSNFVSTSAVKVNGVARATTFFSPSQLTADIPASDIASAGTPAVTVTNPIPGGGTSAGVNLTVNNPVPSISGLSPSTKTVGSGQFTLTINGTNFVSTSVVKFEGAVRATSFVSATKVTAVIPASDIASVGTFTVTVTNPSPGGGTTVPGASLAVNNPVPSINSLAPSSVIVGGAGFPLTVNGSGFINGSIVRVNGVDRATTFLNAAQLTTQILGSDIQATGTLSITVDNPLPGGGTSGPSALSVENPVPSLSTIAPVSKVAGDPGFTLTVNGANFIVGSVVRWNGSDRPTTFANSGRLTANITAADVANAGTPAVTVFNPAPGGGTSGSILFSVIGPNPIAAITSLSPAQAIEGTGAFELTLNGTNFISTSVVRWNGSSRTTTFTNSTTLRAQITASDVGSPGSFPITVFNPTPGGGTSTPVNFTVTMANPVPSITNLSPNNVSAGGAALLITVNGANFVGSSKVRWNGANCVTNFVSATQLTAQITSANIATAGANQVDVFNPAPGGGTSTAVNFTVNNPMPVITSLSNTSAIAGDPAFTLTINGANFVGSSKVRWNGSNFVTSFVSATRLTTQITATDIATAGMNQVDVFSPAPGGGNSTAENFTVNNPMPAIASLSSISAITGDPDFTLTVNGSNFVGGSTVQWNGAARPTAFIHATKVTASITAADVASAGNFPVTVVNPAPGGGTSSGVMFTVNQAPPPKTAQFSTSSMNINEGSGAVTVTVTRSGDLSNEVTIDYHTVDGTATERNDYTTAIGRLRFAPGESQKTISLLITEDSKTEGQESATIVLSNPTGGVTLGNPSVLTFDINDDVVEPPTNPNDDSATFVRQHYHDFLNREADPAGLAFWMNEIESCGANAQCRDVKRINVSAAFFLSVEFQGTGYFVYRFYKAALPPTPSRLAGLPRYRELLADAQEVGRGVVVLQAGWEQQLEQNKKRYADTFVTRAEFTSLYPTSMTPAAFVDALNTQAGGPLSQAQRDGLVAGLTSGVETRATALRKIVEDADFGRQEFNRAFVLMQYIGYLRRSPDDLPDTNLAGYDFWLKKLNDFHGDFIQAEMVKAFITSTEYRFRFGL